MNTPGPVEGSELRVAPMRPQDIPKIHAAYDRLEGEGKRFFHPGFLGSEPLSLRGVMGRLLLRVSARPLGYRILHAVRVLPFLIGAVARDRSVICGFAFVLSRAPIDRTPGTFGIFVLPGYEGHGLGGRLTRYVLEAARTAGLGEVELTVQVVNDRARSLYERHGFSVVQKISRGDRYGGHAYDCLRMTLQLGRDAKRHDPETSS